MHKLTEEIRRLVNCKALLINDYLITENQILRSKLPARIRLIENDRRALVKHGMAIKEMLDQVMTIVRPETLLAWNRRMKKQKWTFDNTPKHPGRPQKAKAAESIILRLARENAWGYKRIAGEMKKLGYAVSPSYVRDLLKNNGFAPCPNRKGLSWKQCMQSHMDFAWAADFFTEEVWTRAGLMTCYVLFFIHLQTRKIHIAGCTHSPDSAWVAQQARAA